MANYATLKSAIQEVVKTNGNREITGAIMQQTLLAMINSLGADYQFAGVASPSTNPGTPDQNVVYIGGPGTYSNFNGAVVNPGYIGVFKYNGSWITDTIAVGKDYDAQIAQLLAEINGIEPTTETILVAVQSGHSVDTRSNPASMPAPLLSGVTYKIKTTGAIATNVRLYTLSETGEAVPCYWAGSSSTANYGTLTSTEKTCVPTGRIAKYAIYINSAHAIATGNETITIVSVGQDGIKQQIIALQAQDRDLADDIADLDEKKLDKIIGTNLYNKDLATTGKYINASTGNLSNAASGEYGVSPFIKINGQSIASNGYSSSSSIAAYAVYDQAKNFLRSSTTSNYTYDGTTYPNDYYIRFTFRNYATGRANYGTTLQPLLPYTEYKPVQDLDLRVSAMEPEIANIPNKVEKIIGTNIYDKTLATGSKYLSASTGAPVNTATETYGVSPYIEINGQSIASNAYTSAPSTVASYVVYDVNKNILRIVAGNAFYVWDGETNPNDYYIRFTFRPYSSGRANYGTTLAPYQEYTDFAPVQDLQQRVTALESVSDPTINYTGISLFKKVGVVGDSYSSGATYLGDSSDGAHYEMSWLQIMARRNGFTGADYATPAQNTTKFLDPNDSRYNTRGLGALLADAAQELYFVMLGINAEPDGVSIGTISDCNVDWTQNASSFYGNLGKIYGNIQSHAPNAKIVFIVANMLFSNHNPAVNATKRQAIIDVAEFYGVAWMEAADEPFFSSDFYISMLATNHPVGVTYAGMAIGFERLFAKCVQANSLYFKNVIIQ